MEALTYLKPKSIEEAYETFLGSANNHVLGGGAWIKLSLKNVDTLIELEGIVSRDIVATKDTIQIGAMATLRQMEQHPILANHLGGFLPNVVKRIMGVTVRNVATIGGTIVGAYAFSDLLTALLALDAKLIFHKQGRISLSTYLKNPAVKDILLAVELANVSGKAYFHKIANTSLDFAILNIAIVKHPQGVRITIGSRPAGPQEAVRCAQFLNSRSIVGQEDIEQAAKLASEEISFGSNFRAEANYRQTLAQVYVKRGLTEVFHHES